MIVAGKADVLVIGAGIVGIATAAAWARRGKSVILLEREERPVGASIRNFGLVWLMGQPAGRLWDRALCGRRLWLQYAAEAGFAAHETGSLHLARQDAEARVLQEFLELAAPPDFRGRWVGPDEAAVLSPAVRREGLHGALWSPYELTVDGREALPALLRHLTRNCGVRAVMDAAVSRIEAPRVISAAGVWEAAQIFVCTGPELRILYPEVHRYAGITNCKLQMARTAPQPDGWRLGPALCGGLTLIHYAAFEACPGLPALRAEFDRTHAGYLANGIHVLASQNARGEVLIGDTHHYGLTHDPFLHEEYDAMVRGYLGELAAIPDLRVTQRWVGVYPKLRGATEFVFNPEPGVTIVNALGGAGMTLSFGLAEELAESD